jgi:hypothetical protein
MAGATVPTSTEAEHVDNAQRTRPIFYANDSARDMVLHSPLWEFWYSADGALEVVSHACEICCGYEAKHFYRNSRFMEAILLEEHLPLWHGLWRKMDEGENYACAEFQIRLPDSKKRWMKFEASRDLDADGCDCGILIHREHKVCCCTTIIVLSRIKDYWVIVNILNRYGDLLRINTAVFRCRTDNHILE